MLTCARQELAGAGCQRCGQDTTRIPKGGAGPNERAGEQAKGEEKEGKNSKRRGEERRGGRVGSDRPKQNVGVGPGLA